MNVVITWPRNRSLDSYLGECEKAMRAGLQINFRVPSAPRTYRGDRCYVVHDGRIVGWNDVIDVANRDDVIDPISGARWPPGIYIIRDPRFIGWSAKEIRVRGFQGYRYARTVGLP